MLLTSDFGDSGVFEIDTDGGESKTGLKMAFRGCGYLIGVLKMTPGDLYKG